MATSTVRPTAARHFTAMLQMAGLLGCQLQPTSENPALLRGFCPFHPAETLSLAHTLKIDTRSAKFWCHICDLNGSPITFISIVWGISARDAQQLLDTNPELTIKRPPYPDTFFLRSQGLPPQNSAVLTRATRYYGKQVYNHYPALQFLARLNVHPEAAVKAGIGYCPGAGLREHLEELEFLPEEISNSPLINQVTGFETFAGRITLADRDFAGGTVWMTSGEPEDHADSSHWSVKRPHVYGIAGPRPAVLNILRLERGTRQVAVTDDLRLYIVLAARQTPAVLITRRTRDRSEAQDTAHRISQALKDRGARNIVIAVHNGLLRHSLRDSFLTLVPASHSPIRTRDQIIQALNPDRRNLDSFLDTRERPAENSNHQSPHSAPSPSQEATLPTDVSHSQDPPEPSIPQPEDPQHPETGPAPPL